MYKLLIFLSFIYQCFALCKNASTFDKTNSLLVDTQYQYNWYYGVLSQQSGTILIRTQSLNNCSSNLILIYGSVMYYNQTSHKYDHYQSLSLPMTKQKLEWNSWKFIINSSYAFLTFPGGNIEIELSSQYLQGINGNGMVRSGLGGNTAIATSFPNSIYRAFGYPGITGYFENVKTSYSDTKHLSWICIYVFSKNWYGFMCRSTINPLNPFAHGMIIQNGVERWLPSWAFRIDDPKCQVISKVANATFNHCYHVRFQTDLAETINFDIAPIDGDFGYESHTNVAWTGASNAINRSDIHVIIEIVLQKKQ